MKNVAKVIFNQNPQRLSCIEFGSMGMKKHYEHGNYHSIGFSCGDIFQIVLGQEVYTNYPDIEQELAENVLKNFIGSVASQETAMRMELTINGYIAERNMKNKWL